MIYQNIISAPHTIITVLIDPEKYDEKKLDSVINVCEKVSIPFLLIGGSLVSDFLDNIIIQIKKKTNLPIVLFPGNLLQLSKEADALLLLSLISGRNPEFLIGNHVIAASYIKNSGIEVIPTGYILIDGGHVSSVQYMSNTMPIPSSKTDLIVSTAIAGFLLGLKAIYLEAGSGAIYSVNPYAVQKVKENISVPVFVGGGIRTATQIEQYVKAGADIVVIGNSIENDPDNLIQMLNDFL